MGDEGTGPPAVTQATPHVAGNAALPPRSAPVTVLAWNLILLGAIMAALAGLQFVILVVLLPPDAMQMALDQVTGGLPVPAPVVFLVDHLAAILSTLLIVGLLSLVAGIGLLRRHEWARRAVLAMMWLNIVAHAAGAVVPFLGSSGEEAAPRATTSLVFTGREQALVVALSVALAVAVCVFSAWAIRLLRAANVRREFAAR